MQIQFWIHGSNKYFQTLFLNVIGTFKIVSFINDILFFPETHRDIQLPFTVNSKATGQMLFLLPQMDLEYLLESTPTPSKVFKEAPQHTINNRARPALLIWRGLLTWYWWNDLRFNRSNGTTVFHDHNYIVSLFVLVLLMYFSMCLHSHALFGISILSW